MYQFITGPLLWLSFGICIVGLIVRVVRYVRGLDWKLDRVAYTAHPLQGIWGAIRSIIHWLVPFGSYGWRAKPLYAITFFAFHVGLVVTPLFLPGHAVIIQAALGRALAHDLHGPGRRSDHHGHLSPRSSSPCAASVCRRCASSPRFMITSCS